MTHAFSQSKNSRPFVGCEKMDVTVVYALKNILQVSAYLQMLG